MRDECAGSWEITKVSNIHNWSDDKKSAISLAMIHTNDDFSSLNDHICANNNSVYTI